MADILLGYECPTCAEDCEDFVMPAVKSDYCPNSMRLELAEIKRIFITIHDDENPGEALGGPADWTSAASWATAIDQTTAGKVRSLHGVGDLPDPEDTTVTVHDNQQVVIERRRTLNFDVMDINTLNHEAMRKLQCGGSGRLWYESRGGYLYGGQNGIGINIIPPTSPHARGADSFKAIKFVFRWNSICDPERIPSPFAGGSAGGGEEEGGGGGA